MSVPAVGVQRGGGRAAGRVGGEACHVTGYDDRRSGVRGSGRAQRPAQAAAGRPQLDRGRVRAGAERRSDVVEQHDRHRLRDVGEREPGVQVDRVDPDLAGPHPRHLGRGYRPSPRRPHPHVPAPRGQPSGGRGKTRARGVQVRQGLASGAPGSRLDLGGALVRTGVHRLFLAGAGPGQQVHQGVSVAGDVGDHVRAGPAGKAGRLPERRTARRRLEGLGALRDPPEQDLYPGARGGHPRHVRSLTQTLRHSPMPWTRVRSTAPSSR